MKYKDGLEKGILIKRYKRFLADVTTEQGRDITMHCPNTGSMKNCMDQGSVVWYSTSDNPKRKYQHTWEFVEPLSGGVIGINTNLANSLVEEALAKGVIEELNHYSNIQREVKYGSQKSRIDLLLSHEDQSIPDCYVEVKNVSLHMGGGQGLFPDAKTERGQKHLQELMLVASQGYRAVLLFCVQHSEIETVSPADNIDMKYGELLREAAKQGVEILAYGSAFYLDDGLVYLTKKLKVLL